MEKIRCEGEGEIEIKEIGMETEVVWGDNKSRQKKQHWCGCYISIGGLSHSIQIWRHQYHVVLGSDTNVLRSY